MKLIIALLFLILIHSIPSHAASAPDKFYIGFAAGYSKYLGQVKRTLDRYNKTNGNGRLVPRVEPIGVYWRLTNPKFLAGLKFSADLDGFSVKHADFYFLKFYFGLSGLYFPNSENQKGLFFRTDAGVIRQLLAGDPHFEPETSWGLNSEFAIGYAFQVFDRKQLLLQLHLNPQYIKSNYEQNIGVNIGALF